MASRENEEICGSVVEDPVEKARHTTNTGATSMFRGIYDYNQGQGVFDEEGLDVGVCAMDNGKNVPYTSESVT